MTTKHEGFKKLGLIVAAGLLAGACSPMAPSVSKLSNAAGQKTTPTDGSSPSTNITTSPSGSSLVAASKALALANGGTQSTRGVTPAQYQATWSMKVEMKPEIDFKGHLRALADFKSNGTARFAISDDMRAKADVLLSKNTVIFLIVSEDDSGTTAGILPPGLQVSLSALPADADEPAQWQLSLVAPNTGDPVKDLDEEKQALRSLQEHLTDVVIEFEAD